MNFSHPCADTSCVVPHCSPTCITHRQCGSSVCSTAHGWTTATGARTIRIHTFVVSFVTSADVWRCSRRLSGSVQVHLQRRPLFFRPSPLKDVDVITNLFSGSRYLTFHHALCLITYQYNHHRRSFLSFEINPECYMTFLGLVMTTIGGWCVSNDVWLSPVDIVQSVRWEKLFNEKRDE